MVPQAKAVKQVKKVGSSSVSVATALELKFPKQADEIVSVMMGAATSASMKRKLARVQEALESLRKAGS